MLVLSVLVVCKLVAALHVSKNGEHMCASMPQKSGNNSLCANDTSKCKMEVCPKKYSQKGCVTVYKNESGVMKTVFMGCFDIYSHEECELESCSLKLHQDLYTCCCKESMCNLNITLKLDDTSTQSPSVSTHTKMVNRTQTQAPTSDSMLLVYILAPTFSFIIIFGILAHLLKKRKDSIRRENNHLLEPQHTHSPITPCRPIQILETIHRGQFADVSKALYMHKVVAVKNIQSMQYQLWTNERDIYEKCNLSHENVLSFISAQKEWKNDSFQYSIITEYCGNGSLGDYLKKYTVNISDLITMTLCIIKGLVYLHAGSSVRPPVAHRDLKSTNILVKEDLTCCIADFGLSMPFPAESNNAISTDMSQVGTKRYMAPEILRGAITFSPECFLSIDMYAFALVCWELLSRCVISQDPPDAYAPPYCIEVGYHPSLENMIRCVVDENKRPVIKELWKSHKILCAFCETIEECWDVDAYARIGANLAFFRLSKLTLPDSSSDENVSTSLSKEQDNCVESSDSTLGLTVLLNDKESE